MCSMLLIIPLADYATCKIPTKKAKKRVSWSPELTTIRTIPSLEEQKQEELLYELKDLKEDLHRLHQKLLT